jgi:hypothetical protein
MLQGLPPEAKFGKISLGASALRERDQCGHAGFNFHQGSQHSENQSRNELGGQGLEAHTRSTGAVARASTAVCSTVAI